MEVDTAGGGITAEEMDQQRLQNVAYEYLCHLEEAKKWLEACIKEELPPTTELEEGLRNGVYLAKLAHFFAPSAVSLKKVYDIEQARGLQFRHTDNINHWLKALKHINLPATFYPETTDLYDKKNMPKVIYCVHALSLFLFKLGLAPKIQDLYGRVNFSEEEINAVRVELEKYGIQMPAFSKIGGILAKEMPGDEAALHAAIIAINKAIDGNDKSELLIALKNHAASLNNVEDDAVILYLKSLTSAKADKTQNSRNRSYDSDYVADVYDELLTKAEIQKHINNMNCQLALDKVMAAVIAGDEGELFRALSSPYLKLKDLKVHNLPHYIEEFRKMLDTKNEESTLDKNFLQDVIGNVNDVNDKEKKRISALKDINEALRQGTAADTLAALKNPCADIQNVKDSAAALYHLEFAHIQREMKTDLTYSDITGGVKVLSAIAGINEAIAMDDHPIGLYDALMHPDAHIEHVQRELEARYLAAFLQMLESKVKEDAPCLMLTHFEIQSQVDEVNGIAQIEQDEINALAGINVAIKSPNFENTMDALKNPYAGIQNLDVNCASLYHDMLLSFWKQKSQDENKDAELSVDEIQHIVEKCNNLHSLAQRFCNALSAINIAIDKESLEELTTALQNPDARLPNPIVACVHIYLKLFSAWQKKHDEGKKKPKVILYETKYGMSYMWDIEASEGMWYPEDKIDMESSCLNRNDIQAIMTSVNSEYNKQTVEKSLEPTIILLQAYAKGMLARKAFKSRLTFLNSQTEQAIKIQAWWRGATERLRYQAKLGEFKSKAPAAIVIQSSVRMLLARKSFLKAQEQRRKEEIAAIKIQQFWRSNQARRDFHAMMNSEAPSFTIVKKFVHLLDLNNLDFSEELELHKLRGEVVQFIRQNQQLERDLNDMDIKIGLLVKNRITLQDVVAHGKKLDKKSRQNAFGGEEMNGEGSILSLKSLSKKHREKMEAYQHLFYLLQTNPVYLARLIFVMPHGKTTKFIESVIYSLYNFASNPREEFLLLQLFETALQEEIRCRVDQPSDMITGTPLVIKMIVSFHRNRRGPTSLREFLGPLVLHVLNDKNLHINLNPAEVYKVWVNQVESQTGQPMGLKYEVTNDQALEYPEVKLRIQSAVENLQKATAMFFETILNSLDKIPYGMRYMAKVLKANLQEKFPDSHEKDHFKAVGNLLYYRYINSAIAAPDAFDIVDVAADNSLTNEQRRNLGSIAKILQFAAAKKGFGEESPHLMCMNDYIKSCHKKFKSFFRKACEVEDLAKHFHIDEFSEATMLVKPTIYMSFQEIIDTHLRLLEFEDEIAPDPNDVLHEMLKDLGDKPDLDALIGDKADPTTQPQFMKTEICLTLSNKFSVPENSDSDINRILVRTKQMLVDTMRCLPATSLKRLLKTHPTQQQREDYKIIAAKKRRPHKERGKHTSNRMSFLQDNIDDNELTLDEVLDALKRNLGLLEKAGYVSKKDHYQGLLNAVAKDIRNQRRYRRRRKQELSQLQSTHTSLLAKTTFYQEQIDYYNTYIEQCLANMSTFGKKSANKKLKQRTALKYNGQKLYEKGILVDIEDLPDVQLKNIQFEITPLEASGFFEVTAKFMGVEMEKAQVSIQNLLQNQYDGIPLMMVGKAKVNVNLLLFLLNTKFYGKS